MGNPKFLLSLHPSPPSVDINQGYLALQYGITERWAADLNIGPTTVGWRYFSNGKIVDTTGLMDVSFGVRYQLLNIYCPRDLREINDSIEAGFSYTTSKRHIRYGFNSRVVFVGSNTDRAFWFGGSLDVPIGGRHGF